MVQVATVKEPVKKTKTVKWLPNKKRKIKIKYLNLNEARKNIF